MPLIKLIPNHPNLFNRSSVETVYWIGRQLVLFKFSIRHSVYMKHYDFYKEDWWTLSSSWRVIKSIEKSNWILPHLHPIEPCRTMVMVCTVNPNGQCIYFCVKHWKIFIFEIRFVVLPENFEFKNVLYSIGQFLSPIYFEIELNSMWDLR